MALVVNSPPTLPVQPVGTPNPATGVVTGTVIATDPDHEPLTYTVASGPTKGTAQLNSLTGTYTYTPTEAARLAVGATPTAATDSFTVAVSDGQQTTTAPVSVLISPARFESEASIAVGVNPSAAVVGADGRMYVANTGGNSVSVINTVSGQRINAKTRWFSTDIAVGSAPSALALSADGTRLYVANAGSGTVSVINTANYRRIDANPNWFSKDIAVGSAPSAMTFGPGGRLYVANHGNNTVSVINTTTNALVDTNANVAGIQSIPVESAPSALTLGPDGRLYVANQSSNTVSVIMTSNYEVVNTVNVGSQPTGLTLGADGRLFVANAGNNTVSVFNTVTNVIAAEAISVGPSPSSVVLSPTGSLAYVTNANDTVSVIDTASYTVVSTVPFDTDATGGHAVAVGPNGTVYVTDALDNTVRVLSIRGNSAPVAGAPTIGAPNSETGAVTGALNFSDPDKDALSYSVLTQPASGTVTVDAAGTFTYTPNQTARQQAAQTPGTDFATFTVNATDGRATTPVGVTVTIAPPTAHVATGVALIANNVTLTGYPDAQVFTPDGTRAVLTTDATDWNTGVLSTRVAVVDTSTGKQIGTTVSLAGIPDDSLLLNADGTRAVITTHSANVVSVTVINTTTGTQLGTTLTLNGDPTPTVLSANGTRAVITARSLDLATGGTRVAVINPTTGAQTGATLKLPGYQSSTWNAGSNALVTTIEGDWTSGFATQVAVIDTANGTQAGTTVALAGRFEGSPLLSANGTRALIATNGEVAVINTTTGAKLGSTLTPTGASVSALMTADAGRVLVTTSVDVTATQPASTQLLLIDAATGAQIGNTVTLAGALWSPPTNADPTHALVATYLTAPATYTIVGTQLWVIDTTTGAQTGSTLNLAGRLQVTQPLFSADRTRALVTAVGGATMVVDTTTGTQSGTTFNLTGEPKSFQLVSADRTRALIATTIPSSPSSDSGTTRVTLIDTSTGTQLGTTPTVPGESGVVQLNAAGTQALLTTAVYDPAARFSDPHSTRVAVIDTATGKQLGTTITLSGAIYGSQPLSVDGTNFLITTAPWNPWTGAPSTQLVVINSTTGKQTGGTLTLAGDPSGAPLLSANGTRVLIATAAPKGSTQTITRVAVLRIV